MNRALLAELQRQQSYPSITLLVNTTPGSGLDPSEITNIRQLVVRAEQRLRDDVIDSLRVALIDRLTRLIDDVRDQPASEALAVCVSPDYTTAVRLGSRVDERVVIDDTFATRDLVADLNRSALYRVVTLSDRKVRVLVGDRRNLVEERTEAWPMLRPDEVGDRVWWRTVTQALRDQHARHPLPTVIAGVDRSVRSADIADHLETIGIVAGNHDRTSWADLHELAWASVERWLDDGRDAALVRLDQARSARRYAGGINEIWPLANDGRVELLLVAEPFTMPARVDANRQLQRADDPEAPDVVDDIVDETIELVLRHGGDAVFVNDDDLADHHGIAAVLRY